MKTVVQYYIPKRCFQFYFICYIRYTYTYIYFIYKIISIYVYRSQFVILYFQVTTELYTRPTKVFRITNEIYLPVYSYGQTYFNMCIETCNKTNTKAVKWYFWFVMYIIKVFHNNLIKMTRCVYLITIVHGLTIISLKV